MPARMLQAVRAAVPEPIKQLVRRIRGRQIDKHSSEAAWWVNHPELTDRKLTDERFRLVMLAIAQEPDESFLAGKIVADFGCGPRGTLTWLTGARAKYGIDVLVPRYAEAFPDSIRAHGMTYITSTEHVIPMPSASVDILFTINALDHVDNLQAMCDESVRILKPEGELIASFNLHEPASTCEPQCLTEELLDEALLSRFAPRSVRFGRSQQPDRFVEMFNGPSTYRKGEKGYMWYRGTKRI